MTTDPSGLGSHIATHRPAGGVAGLENRSGVRIGLLTLTGLIIGLIPGLFVALFTDFVPALAIGAVLGAIAGFLWARSLNFDAAVSEARVHSDGVVLVDPRGTHSVRWDEIASFEGKQIQNVAGTGMFGVGDIKGVVSHSYVLRTRDGAGYWLDNRIDRVGELAETIARASNVRMTPMP